MNISYNWLREYVPTKYNAQQVADMLTFSGLEVEQIEPIESIKGGLDKYYIGEVLTCIPHPNSDHLHITTVDIGKEILNIVCGAPNVDKGQKVVVATIGAKVYEGDEFFEIKKSKLRGEPSEGMICSEKELQLGSNHDGIMVLDPSAQVGMPAKKYFNIKQDTLLEIGLTANRSDATSHIGVGRDLLATLKTYNEDIDINIPSVDEFKLDNTTNHVEVAIDQNLCKRYTGVCVSNVKIASSPSWLQEHLIAVGIRPINNIVDITNFVLYEIGQPLHAFDLDKIQGNQIKVQTVEKGTFFTTLDGVKRELLGTEAMICNSKEPMCLAGIFGGKDFGVTDKTTNIFIESAYFNPVVIRKAAKYHQLSTDASFRYERGADPNITLYALKRCCLLIKQLCPQSQISSEVIDIYPEIIDRPTIDLSFAYLDSLVGKQIDRNIIKSILSNLNMEIVAIDTEHIVVKVPTNKVDVLRPCDLAEEILRIYGYNNIDFAQNVTSALSYIPKPDKEKLQATITSYLSDNGFNEIINNSLTPISYYNENNKDFDISNSVRIINPLSSDLTLMRQTLLYGGLEVVSFNLNRQFSNIRIFEFGNCYLHNTKVPDSVPVDKRYTQTKHLMLMVTGKCMDASWHVKPLEMDFFYVKNIVFNILKRLRINIDNIILKHDNPDYLSDGVTLINKDSKKVIAILGIVASKTKKRFDIKQRVYYADIIWDNVIKLIPKVDIKYTPISKAPYVSTDLALVVNKDVEYQTIKDIVINCDKKLIRSVNLFDIYESEKLGDKKQYAITIILQDNERTLQDKQISSLVNKIVKELSDKLGATLR